MNDKHDSVGDELREISDDLTWYEPDDPTPREKCPCCDYVSLEERNNYLICPICFWEDDGVDIDDPDEHSGPNHMTLREGRRNFLLVGACNENVINDVLPACERSSFEHRPRKV